MKAHARALVALTVLAFALVMAGCPNGIGSAESGITAMVFTAAANTGLAADVTATISGTYVAVAIPVGVSLSALVPTITVSAGATVSPASDAAQDFSGPVTYTVTSENGEKTTDYTVVVNLTGDAVMSSLVFAAADNTGLSSDVTATIQGTYVTASFALGTAVTALVPTITVSSGATVSPASGAAQDFSSPITYTVTCEDGAHTTNYTVVASVGAADITPPIAGGSGVLTLVPADAYSIAVSWTRATDNADSQASLQYKVVRSTSNNIATAADAQANGTTVMDWTANAASATAGSLTAGGLYYFNTLARDSGGNVTAYASRAVSLLTRVSSASTAYDYRAGTAVAISSDGSTMVIGAVRNASYPGEAYVFEKAAGAWTQKATLKPGSQYANDRFGQSVSIDSDGSTIAIADASYGSCVYDRPAGGWVDAAIETYRYTAAGWAVALSADGSALAAAVTTSSTNVRIILRAGATWTTPVSEYSLSTSGAAPVGDSISISADGTTVVAGGIYSVSTSRGSVFIWVKSGTNWAAAAQETRQLTYSGAADNDQLGFSVAISPDGTTIAAGAPGAGTGAGLVCIYNRPATGWADHAASQDSTLPAPSGLAVNDWFGNSLSFTTTAGLLAVGCYGDTLEGKNDQGSAYLYARSGSSYAYSSKLCEVSTGVASDMFGSSVSLTGDGSVLVVGCPFEDYVATDAGLAFVFAF